MLTSGTKPRRPGRRGYTTANVCGQSGNPARTIQNRALLDRPGQAHVLMLQRKCCSVALCHGNKLRPNERDRGRGQNASRVQVDPPQNSCPDSFQCLERAYGLLGWGSL